LSIIALTLRLSEHLKSLDLQNDLPAEARH
jgi:hypothetical protein